MYSECLGHYEHELLSNISLILFIDQSKLYLSKEMINIIWVLIQEIEENKIWTPHLQESRVCFWDHELDKMFEDTKGVIRSHKLEERQYNGQ